MPNMGIFPGYRGPDTSVVNDASTSTKHTLGVPQPPQPPSFNKPSWWTDYQYSGAYEPGAELAMSVNTLLPYMSPIDRKYWSSWLYQQDPSRFGNYAPGKIDQSAYGEEGDLASRGSFTAADRANQAWTALSNKLLNKEDTNAANDAKIEDMGPAVPWLQRVFGALQQYSTPDQTSRRTRAQERSLQNELNQFWSEAQGSEDLQPYLELAKRFVAPSFQNAPISTPTPMGARESAYQQPYTSYTRNNYVSNPRWL